MFALLFLNMSDNLKRYVLASELHENRMEEQSSSVNFTSAEERLSEGLLDTPESFQREILLYKWIMEAVEQYMTETGKKDVFVCDLKNDVLYGNNEFILVDQESTKYEYSIVMQDGVDMGQNRYKLKLNGTKYILYVDVNIQEAKVYIYPAEDLGVISGGVGNWKAYEQIEKDENGQIIYYPDTYVQSDWDNFERQDNHFAGVSFDELEQLDFLKIPQDSMEYYAVINLNVASVLKRYIEENQIEDVFYFDADKDVIARVTNMIYTCRIRGKTMTLYIDIDGFNMKAHVYQMED